MRLNNSCYVLLLGMDELMFQMVCYKKILKLYNYLIYVV